MASQTFLPSEPRPTQSLSSRAFSDEIQCSSDSTVALPLSPSLILAAAALPSLPSLPLPACFFLMPSYTR